MSVIVGAKTIEQLDDNLAATDIRLSDEDLAQLDLVSALPQEYPGWMIQAQNADRQFSHVVGVGAFAQTAGAASR